jgi:hypothetical protein
MASSRILRGLRRDREWRAPRGAAAGGAGGIFARWRYLRGVLFDSALLFEAGEDRADGASRFWCLKNSLLITAPASARPIRYPGKFHSNQRHGIGYA